MRVTSEQFHLYVAPVCLGEHRRIRTQLFLHEVVALAGLSISQIDSASADALQISYNIAAKYVKIMEELEILMQINEQSRY